MRFHIADNFAASLPKPGGDGWRTPARRLRRPFRELKTTLKAESDVDAWATLHSDVSRPFPLPASGRIAVKVINRLGNEAMKLFRA